MDAATALTSLTSLCAAASDPVLDTDTLTAILVRARRVDTDNRIVSDPDWTPTFDLDWAAMTAWETKAGIAAARFDFDNDGGKFSRSQVTKACLNMAAQYRGRLACTVEVPLAAWAEPEATGWWG